MRLHTYLEVPRFEYVCVDPSISPQHYLLCHRTVGHCLVDTERELGCFCCRSDNCNTKWFTIRSKRGCSAHSRARFHCPPQCPPVYPQVHPHPHLVSKPCCVTFCDHTCTGTVRGGVKKGRKELEGWAGGEKEKEVEGGKEVEKG